MHQLILMRHAKAERAGGDEPDHGRALTSGGREAATRMHASLRMLGIAPDVVLVSSARRTRETLECVAAWDDQPNVEILDALYMASGARLHGIISGLRETMRSVLVIGHNPGVHELALNLAGGAPHGLPAHLKLAEGFPTARLADFVILTPWRDLRAAGARLQHVVDSPKS